MKKALLLALALACAACQKEKPEKSRVGPATADESIKKSLSSSGNKTRLSSEAGRLVRAEGSRLQFWLPENAVRISRHPTYHRESPFLLVTSFEESQSAPARTLDELVGDFVEGSGGTFQEVSRAEREGGNEVLFELTSEGGPLGRALLLKKGQRLGSLTVVYEPAAEEEAKSILKSAHLDPQVELAPLDFYGLTLQEMGQLSVHQPSTRGKIQLLRAQADERLTQEEGQAVIQIAEPKNKGYSDEELSDLIVGTLDGWGADIEKLQTGSLEIDGSVATEMAAPGEIEGVPMDFYAFVLRDGRGAIIAGASAPQKTAEQEMPALLTTLRSLRRSRRW